MTTDGEKKDISSGEERSEAGTEEETSPQEDSGGKGAPATPCVHQDLARELRRSLVILREKMESGEIDPLSWMWHFTSFPAARVPRCEDCADFSSCEYGHDMPPLDCFSREDRHQSDELEPESHRDREH